MKRLITGLIAGLILGTAGVAGAVTSGWIGVSGGHACKVGYVSGQKTMICVGTRAGDYGVAYNGSLIMVTRNTAGGKLVKVFVRAQP